MDARSRAHIGSLLAALCLGGLPCPARAAPDGSSDALKQRASQEFVAGDFARAEADLLEIAERHPGTPARRYAVQMLATLYEEKRVDVGKAIAWTRRFLEEYADPRQAGFYRRKLAVLAALEGQQPTFAEYQAIRNAGPSDAALVQRLEALLRAQPDFALRADVLRELAHAYVRLDERRAAVERFEALSRTAEGLSPSDRPVYEKALHNWRLTSTWAVAAWAVVALLLGLALAGRPWQRTTRAHLRQVGLWAAGWLVLSAARLPSYYAASWDENPFRPSAVYVAAMLNLAILAWLFLLTRGVLWRTRPRALRWASPPLAVLMTAAVYYLFLVYEPKGPDILDAFGVEYRHWAERWHTGARPQPPVTVGDPHRERQGGT
jgi:hypothetical protein